MIGKIIFLYKITKLLGEGGMGNVYLAEHTVNKEKKAAIKCLLPQLARHESLRERFKKEAEAMLILDHPNIIKLITYTEDAEGAYIIMEFIEAVDLGRYIKNESGPIPTERALMIMKQVLDGIGYAHRQNLIHRDIKPSNILLTADDHVKIIDFGIAKVMSEADKKLTKTGIQMGAVFYMSPEQVKGKNVDKRSDIYSLGVTFFQMISGQSPYESITTEFEVYNKIVSEPLPLVTSLYPGALGAFDKVIAKATAKDPEQRYSTAEEFSQALTDAFTAGDVTDEDDKGSGRSDDGGEKKKENRWLSFEGITAIIVAIAILVIGGWQCSVHSSYKNLLSDARASYNNEMYASAALDYERAEKKRKTLWFDKGEDLDVLIADCNMQMYKKNGREALKADSFSRAKSPDYDFTAPGFFARAKEFARYNDDYLDKRIELCEKIKTAISEYNSDKPVESSESYDKAISYAKEINEDQLVIDHLNDARNFVRSPQARFLEITTDFDVYESGQRGMRIHFKFETYFMLQHSGTLSVWFYDDRGNDLKDQDGSYRTSDNQVATSVTFKPGYLSTIYNDLAVFMPYDQLHISSSGTYQFKAGAFDYDSQVGTSKMQSFTYSTGY